MSVETLTVSDSGLKLERCGLLVGGDISTLLQSVVKR